MEAGTETAVAHEGLDVPEATDVTDEGLDGRSNRVSHPSEVRQGLGWIHLEVQRMDLLVQTVDQLISIQIPFSTICFPACDFPIVGSS